MHIENGIITTEKLMQAGVSPKQCKVVKEITHKLDIKPVGISMRNNYVVIHTSNIDVVIVTDTNSDSVITSFKTRNTRVLELSIHFNKGDNIEKYIDNCQRIFTACKLTSGFSTQISRRTVNEMVNVIKTALEFNIEYTLIAYNRGNWGVEIKTIEFGTEPIFIAYFSSPSSGSSVERIYINNHEINCGLKLPKEVKERVYSIWSKLKI